MEPKGIVTAAVGPWLEAQLPDARPPFRYELIAAGASNLSFRVTDAAGHTWALRRPPEAGRLATAHDMRREWRVMQALGSSPSGVPVPAMLAFCEDASLSGAPFYVMEFVPGNILRTPRDAEGMTPSQCRRATASLVEVQAAIHGVDLAATGLEDLGPHQSYLKRQLKRWHDQVVKGAVRQLPLLHELHGELERRLPEERCAPALVHGDYRFDNTVLGEDCRIRAVLDWELCTVGDPIADFCWSLLYWSEPEEPSLLPEGPTLAPGFPRRAELRDIYTQATGRDLSDLEYYFGFSWWKMACIVEGVYARMAKGGGGGMAASLEQAADAVVTLLERSRDLVVRL